MPRREYAWDELGTVSKKGQSFRARIDTSSMGGLVKVQGPCRSEKKQRAVEDLLSIRAAADGHTTRMGGLLAMKREALTGNE